MTSAKKLVYTLQAVYEGKGEIKSLQADLNSLNQIEAFRGLEKSFTDSSKALNEAKAKVRDLRREMAKPGGEAFAASYQKARSEVDKLVTAVNKQKEKLNTAREGLRSTGIDVTDLGSKYDELKGKSEAAAKVLAAQAKLGVRPLKDVEREIEGLERAYKDLERSGELSIKELAAAKENLANKTRKLRGETNDWADALERAKGGWLGIVGLVGAGYGLVNLVGTVSANEKMLKTYADTAGMSVSKFQNYAHAVKSVGIEQDKLADISKDLKDKIGDFIETGGGEFADFFENVASKVGLTAEELIKMSGPEALIAVKKAMDDVGISEEKQIFYMEALANDASRLIPLLRDNGKAFKEQAEGASEFTASLTKLDRQAVFDVSESVDDMQESFKTLGAEIVSTLSPVIIGLTTGVKDLALFMGGLPEPIKSTIAALAAGGSAFLVWNLGLRQIFGLLGPGVGQIVAFTGAIRGWAIANALLSKSLGLVSIGLASAYAVGKAYQGFKEMRQAQDEAKAAADRLASSEERLAGKLKKISEETGVAITSGYELNKAVKDGAIHLNEATGKWEKGAGKMSDAHRKIAAAAKESSATQEKVTGEALEEMKRRYQEYAAEVKRLQDEIAGRTRSLAGELREMARSGMSDIDAWRDQKRQAEEYMKIAEQAAQAGDFTTALQYADEAKQLFKGLNTEVKDGETVLIDQQEALATAMDGVRKAGEQGIEILKQQQDAAGDAMKELTAESGFQDLSEGMDESMRQWIKNWEDMGSATMRELGDVEAEIERIIKDREMTIRVKTVEQKRYGGSVGILGFATGGYPADVFRRLSSPYITRGSGQRDDVPALLTKHEFVQPEPAVRFWGLDFMNAVRKRDIDKVMSFFARGFKVGGIVDYAYPAFPSVPLQFAGGGIVSGGGGSGPTDTVNVVLTLPSGNQVGPFQGTRAQVRALEREQRHMNLGRSG